MSYYSYRLLNLLFSLFFTSSSERKKVLKVTSSNPSPSILFVCKGNICRSPYGECYLKSISKHNLAIGSAGLETNDGLNANQDAIINGKNRGIDLTNHRTSILTTEKINQYDLILFMEPIQIIKALIKFPLQRNWNKYILLGELSEESLRTKVIMDPYGQDQSVFNKVFMIIESACNNLIARNMENE